MASAAAIETKLKAAFSPTFIAVVDNSAAHAGHAGARPEGGTHFTVRIVAEVFAGSSRLARQRLVYRALSDELAGDIHALAITAMAPDEGAAASIQGDAEQQGQGQE